MMLTITVVFIISYLPFIIISLADSADAEYCTDMSEAMAVFVDFMLRFYLINNMAKCYHLQFLGRTIQTGMHSDNTKTIFLQRSEEATKPTKMILQRKCVVYKQYLNCVARRFSSHVSPYANTPMQNDIFQFKN